MVKLFNQISLSDTYEECKQYFQNDKPKFLELLTQNLDLSSLIPQTFYWSYYKTLGRDRDYSLLSMLASLILQKILGIPTVSLLINFLRLCREAREFCGLDKVPDNSQFTRFKQDFLPELETFFNHLVDLTEPICQQINSELASTVVFDTSGIEAYVTENNPKFLNSIIRRLKKAYKGKPDADIYKIAYGLMPSCACSNDEIKQLFINGHFCYAYKFAIITNGLGIVRNISFLDKDFKATHPEIIIEKKSDSPDEDKSIADSKALKPVLSDFLNLHPQIKAETFIGDSAFDNFDTYAFLLNDCSFKKALIPIMPRGTNPELPKPNFNESGWPLCPLDNSKTFKPVGWSYEKGRSPRFKWVCPESHHEGKTIVCHCPTPCTSSRYGRTIHTAPNQDLRMYPGVIRDSEQWYKEYKIRGVVEQTIEYFKGPMNCGNPRTQDKLTIKADLFLSGITQLITVILSDKLNKPENLRSLKSLIS